MLVLTASFRAHTPQEQPTIGLDISQFHWRKLSYKGYCLIIVQDGGSGLGCRIRDQDQDFKFLVRGYLGSKPATFRAH